MRAWYSPTVDSLDEGLRQVLAARNDVAAAYLFGSRARGTARAESDVDVAVLYRHPPPAGYAGLPLDLEEGLEKVLGLPVQVLRLNDAPVDLVHRVLRDGRLILQPDPSARIRFEVKARNEYFDLLPTLELYRRGGRRP